jgi:hypothetical protein
MRIRKIKRGGIALAGGALFALSLPAVAAAEETTCRGTIGAETHDNIRVPEGASCVLKGTIAQGTVKVESAASLKAVRVRVIGNVQGENASRVAVVKGSRVGGSVQAKQGGSAKVAKSRITGDIQYDSNAGYLVARLNRVGGSIQVFQNTGGVEVSRNTVNGNLQCKENSPPPTGGSNVVGGNKEDQCASL